MFDCYNVWCELEKAFWPCKLLCTLELGELLSSSYSSIDASFCVIFMASCM